MRLVDLFWIHVIETDKSLSPFYLMSFPYFQNVFPVFTLCHWKPTYLIHCMLLCAEAIMRDRASWSEAAHTDPDHLNLDEFLAFRHPESSHATILTLVDELLDKFGKKPYQNIWECGTDIWSWYEDGAESVNRVVIMSSLFFCNFTQCRWVVSYRHFGTTSFSS